MEISLLAGENIHFVVRLLAAFLAGGLIGWQRELAEKPAGLRTHILVCVGSALITLISIFAFGKMGSDPARITAQIVSGIGFLGAGTIFRYGPSVTGLTTAASLWAVSGIGIALGSGLYFAGFVSTGLIFVTLWLLEYLEKRFVKKGALVLRLSILNQPGVLGQIGTRLGELGVNIEKIKLREEKGERMDCTLQVALPPSQTMMQLISVLREIETVEEVEIL
ncbi:MAG: MgtC/SapB family protein [Candidatus Atribacteria bacterium]|nr:MgtC/SapB family protein [Candidatus Atribacteria bacterium]